MSCSHVLYVFCVKDMKLQTVVLGIWGYRCVYIYILYIILYYRISYHIISYYFILYYSISYCIISYYNILFYVVHIHCIYYMHIYIDITGIPNPQFLQLKKVQHPHAFLG